MSKVAVIYWSGTGHTEAMAEAVAKGADGVLLTCAEVPEDVAAQYGAFALGCPAMGSEELEEDEFGPLFEKLAPSLTGKKVALFGSYGWGDGEWMRTWEDSCRAAGIVLACDSVTCQEDPDADALAACEALGASLK